MTAWDYFLGKLMWEVGFPLVMLALLAVGCVLYLYWPRKFFMRLRRHRRVR